MRRHIISFAIGLILSLALFMSLEAQEVQPQRIQIRVDMTETEDFLRVYFNCEGRVKPVGTAEAGYSSEFFIQPGDLYACGREGHLVFHAPEWYAAIPLDVLRQYDKSDLGLGAFLFCPGGRLQSKFWTYPGPTAHLTCDEAERAFEAQKDGGR